jgi:hypothetical protein
MVRTSSSHPKGRACLATVLSFIAITLIFAAAVFVRLADFRTVTGTPNLEATYHVLLTIKSLEDVPISESHLLPLVTLGNPMDKFIPWGATIPTKDGDFVYTSFPPLGFVVPYFIFKAGSLSVTPQNLIAFNCLLGLISALLLWNLVRKIILDDGHDAIVASICGVIGAGILLFSREGLQSFGLVYWSQSIEQVWLLGQLLALLRLASAPGRKSLILLSALSFLSAYTEWTGVVANSLLAVLMWFSGKHSGYERPKEIAIALLSSTVLAGVAVCAHFFIALGIRETISALHGRFHARSAMMHDADTVSLLEGYVHSYGLFIVIAFACALLIAFRRRDDSPKPATALLAFILMASATPLAENLIMLQHACEFSFDRIKLVTPLSIIISIAFARTIGENFVAGEFCILLALVAGARQNFNSYESQKLLFGDWANTVRANESLRAQVQTLIDVNCATFGTNSKVRGYANLLFDRGMYEFTTPANLLVKANSAGACGSVFLQQADGHTDLPRFISATVVAKAGTAISIYP